MDIVSRFPVLPNVNRPLLLLAAPPTRLALPSPRIAGLLAAGTVLPATARARQRTPNGDYLVFDRRTAHSTWEQIDQMFPTWKEIQAQRGCSMIEAMDAEIDLIHQHYSARRRQILQAAAARQDALRYQHEQRRHEAREHTRQITPAQEVRHE